MNKICPTCKGKGQTKATATVVELWHGGGEVNGKQAKAIRKALQIIKPTPLDGGGLYTKDDRLYFRQAKNPLMNLYRSIKRRYIRGEFTRVHKTHRPSN